MKDARPDYETRTYVLAANTPLALPPARQYLIINASVDDGAVQIATGSNNAEFSQWPAGYSVAIDPTLTARIQSSVAQTVTIALAFGEVLVRDSRSAALSASPWSGRTSLTQGVGAAATVTVVVPATSNVRGIVLLHATLCCLADPTAIAELYDGGGVFASCVDSQAVPVVGPICIPAGQSLRIGMTGGCRVGLSYLIK